MTVKWLMPSERLTHRAGREEDESAAPVPAKQDRAGCGRLNADGSGMRGAGLRAPNARDVMPSCNSASRPMTHSSGLASIPRDVCWQHRPMRTSTKAPRGSARATLWPRAAAVLACTRDHRPSDRRPRLSSVPATHRRPVSRAVRQCRLARPGLRRDHRPVRRRETKNIRRDVRQLDPVPYYGFHARRAPQLTRRTRPVLTVDSTRRAHLRADVRSHAQTLANNRRLRGSFWGSLDFSELTFDR